MKSLRYCLASIFVAVALLPATAQIKFGVKGGVNIASINADKTLEEVFDVESITGFQLGATMEALIPKANVGADVGLLYSQRGFKLKDKVDEQNANARIGYIDIPVNLKWKPSIGKVSLFVAAGPYVSFKISQNIDLKKLGTIQDEFRLFKSKPFSAGMNFGVGAELFKHLQVGVNYALGLTEDYKNDHPESIGEVIQYLNHPKSSMWTITAAYYF